MDLSLDKLREAVSIREQIQSLEDRLNSIFSGAGGGASRSSSGSSSSGYVPVKVDGRRRPMSPATRAKLAAAAKARWARSRGETGGFSGGGSGSSKKSSGLGRGGITEEGR